MISTMRTGPGEHKPSISVERLTQFHRTDLADLCDAADAAIQAGGGFGWVKPPPRHVFESYWKGVLLVPERHLFVGRLDGTIAASAQLVRPTRNNEAQAFSAQLMHHFVAPWARGHGLAKLVTLAVEQAARDNNASLINLDIRETQIAAIQLYEGLGYTRWGVHPHYAKVDGRMIRGFYYYKFLDPEAEADTLTEAALTNPGDAP
jgi:ribosomal protein S18 acetylase RimI-like enzyme